MYVRSYVSTVTSVVQCMQLLDSNDLFCIFNYGYRGYFIRIGQKLSKNGYSRMKPSENFYSKNIPWDKIFLKMNF